MGTLPPQRRQAGGAGGGPGLCTPRNQHREGAEEAERRTGLPTFHGAARPGHFGCVARRSRSATAAPADPPEAARSCGPTSTPGSRPAPEGEQPGAALAPRGAAPRPPWRRVKLDAPVTVQENIAQP